MNIIFKNNKLHFYESKWREKKSDNKIDLDNKLFPFPKKNKQKLSLKYLNFIKRLSLIQNFLIKKKKYKNYKKSKNCLITNKKNIGKKKFVLFSVNWDETLIYYMKNFNIKPSKQFYNFIKNISIKKNSISLNKKYKYPFFKLNGIIFKRYKSKYIKISSNQFRIIDSLFEDGGKKIYDYNKSKKYSEHSGLIDFNINSLERIIVNATPNYIDKNDESIFLPNNMIDEADYELIFHTHPYTPDRIDEGIILDLPSIGDILNFADNYIEGYTQGSLVITREGLYIIKILDDNFGIKYPKKKDIDNLTNEFNNLLESIYYKYYTNYTDKLFYSKIINDISFLETYNKLLEKYNLYIDYYPRIKLNKIYVIPDIKIKLNIIESKLKK